MHHGESEFVGVRCGILDQFASALGRRGHALRIDCRTRSVEPVALEGEQLALLVVHSGVERALTAGAYRERVAECAAAVAGARRARVRDADVQTLRDLVTLGEEQARRETRIVLTKIVVPDDDDVQLNYRLMQRDGGWKVIDVVIEGVSLVANFRSQFAEVMAKGGADELLRQLKTKNFDSIGDDGASG